jgi:hypothetical protein
MTDAAGLNLYAYLPSAGLGHIPLYDPQLLIGSVDLCDFHARHAEILQ